MDLLLKVYALEPIDPSVDNPLPADAFANISQVFNVAFNLVAGIGFSWGFISVSLGLVTIITSGGDKMAFQQGMKKIQYGAYGIIIAMLGIALKGIILGLLGANYSGVGVAVDE